MPTLPLFVPPGVRSPIAWHRVTAPGGYEWWHFDAEDARGDLRVVATLYDGFPFHPEYLRAHARYLRRPTRVAPAVPSQYTCADVAVYDGDRRVVRSLTRYPPGTFTASDERLELSVGPHAVRSDHDGVLQLTLGDVAKLTFRPASHGPTVERRAASRELTGADHHWVLPGTTYEVEGTVYGLGKFGSFPLSGRGYHDRQYGAGPTGWNLRRWVRGHADVRGEVRVFRVAQPRDRHLPDEHYLGATGGGVLRDVIAGPPEIRENPGQATRGLSCPVEIAWAGESQAGDHLRLRGGRVIDATPFSLRVCYEVEDNEGPGAGRAFADVIYPGRLRAPVVGRLVERSIRDTRA